MIPFTIDFRQKLRRRRQEDHVVVAEGDRRVSETGAVFHQRLRSVHNQQKRPRKKMVPSKGFKGQKSFWKA